MFQKSIMICLAIGATALTGCGSKTDANEKNFTPAINQALDKNNQLCVQRNLGFGFGNIQWPMDVPNQMGVFNAKQLEALAKVGLVSGSDTEVEQINMFTSKPTGHKFKVTRYTLTDMGKKYSRAKDSNICYGTAAVDKVVKWEGPRKDGDYQEALVKFTYQIKDLAEWANDPAILAAFLNVKDAIEGAGKQEQAIELKLTSQGWESKH